MSGETCGYDGWRNGTAFCACGARFDSVQDFERHIGTPTPVPSEVAETTAGEHHPACYQSTGVPDYLPAGLCDCKVLRMLDAAEATAGERECGCPNAWVGNGGGHMCPPPAEPDAGEVEEWEYAIEGDWLVQVVNKHTCGTGPDGYYGAHEPGCGSIPVANIGPLLDRVRREEGERIAQAIEAGVLPSHPNEGYKDGFRRAAQIARAASVGRGEGL